MDAVEEHVTVDSKSTSKRRGVGTKAGIGLDEIVQAGRALSPGQITMQAIANHLGVDRSAINHHVKGRGHLLKLVAHASFRDVFPEVDINGTWQEISLSYARGYMEALYLLGPLAEHFDALVQQEAGMRVSEALLQSMISAGFSDEDAVRYLVLLGHLARGHALDRISMQSEGYATRPQQTQRVLSALDRSEFPVLDRVSANPFDTYGDAQFTASLNTVVAGAEAMLKASR